MSKELKPCPFCGQDVSIGPVDDCTHYWYVCCEDCDITRFIFGAKQEAIKIWNTRPAEDALKAENEELAGYVKRFRETLAEVAQMANNSEQEQIFEKCRDALRDVYLEEIFRDKFDKILHAPDTRKGGEDEVR